jgi:DNA-binding NarL/FixJ family response regulator
MEAMKILLLNHSLPVRFRLTRQLWAMPGVSQVIATAEGLHALRLLKHMQPAMLLLDLDLPSSDPIQLIPQFKQEIRDLKVMALTSKATDYKRQRYLRAGVDGFFDQSTDYELLLTQLRQLSDSNPLQVAS